MFSDFFTSLFFFLLSLIYSNFYTLFELYSNIRFYWHLWSVHASQSIIKPSPDLFLGIILSWIVHQTYGKERKKTQSSSVILKVKSDY